MIVMIYLIDRINTGESVSENLIMNIKKIKKITVQSFKFYLRMSILRVAVKSPAVSV